VPIEAFAISQQSVAACFSEPRITALSLSPKSLSGPVCSTDNDLDRLRTEYTASREVVGVLQKRFTALSEATILRHLIASGGDAERVVVQL